MNHYKQRKDLNEKEVNEILEEGYKLHSVTPFYFQHRESRGAEGNTTLIYHFVWDYEREYIVEQEFKLMEDTLLSDINGNDTLGPLL